MSTGTWEVVVQGEPDDIAHLKANVRDARIEFATVEDGAVAMRLAEFAACSDHAAVRDLAVQQFAILSGVLKGVRGSRRPLEAGAVLRRRPDGSRDIFVRLEGAQVTVTGGDVGLTEYDVYGNAKPAPDSSSMVRT